MTRRWSAGTRRAGWALISAATACAVAALATLTLLPSTALAQTATATLTDGALGFAVTPGNVVFPTVALDGADKTTTAAWALDMGDNTGSGAGWNVTLTTTAFVGTATGDTLAGTGLSVTAGTAAACDDGVACTPATSTIAYPLTIPPAGEAVALPIASAAAASGMGDQTVTPAFTLHIPASSFVDTYTSTWTVAVVSGP